MRKIGIKFVAFERKGSIENNIFSYKGNDIDEGLAVFKVKMGMEREAEAFKRRIKRR